MSESVSPWNRGIVDEFRANEGRVGGNFQGATLLLLHTVGAHTGAERVNPLMYQDLGGAVAVFATERVERRPIRIGITTWLPIPRSPRSSAPRRVASGLETATDAERDRIWTKQKSDYHGFADYETRTDRVIPVVIPSLSAT